MLLLLFFGGKSVKSAIGNLLQCPQDNEMKLRKKTENQGKSLYFEIISD
jgi:hypothetical protein